MLDCASLQQRQLAELAGELARAKLEGARPSARIFPHGHGPKMPCWAPVRSL